MKLETEGRGEYSSPTDKLIQQELAKLDNSGNNYAILSSENGFLQAAKTAGGYLLEYRDETGYYSSRNENVSLPQVEKAFLLYLSNDNSWKDNFEWNNNEVHTTNDSTVNNATVDDIINGVKKKALNAAKRKLKDFLKF